MFLQIRAFTDKGPVIFTDKVFFTDKGLTDDDDNNDLRERKPPPRRLTSTKSEPEYEFRFLD